MAEAHSGSAALESDKAGDGVPGYSSTTAYQGDFRQISISFVKKEKILHCHGFGVHRAM